MDLSHGAVILFMIEALLLEMCAAAKCPTIKLANGKARLRSRGKMIYFRCRRRFTRIGEKFAICLPNGTWSQKTPICVGRGCPDLGTIPEMEIEELFNGGMLKFTCKAGLRRDGPERITCNGRKWSDKPPTCIDGMSSGCDFESPSLCGWSQDTKDDFDWTWNSGNTPTSGTGPETDVTTKTSQGHYLFIESSAPQKNGHTARLVSPPYHPDVKNICLAFWYHMMGPVGPKDVGDLDVFVKPDSRQITNLGPRYTIFHIAGSQGPEWTRADIDIPAQTELYQLVFQGTRRKSWTSDIAIDDILVYNCSDRSPTTTQEVTTETAVDTSVGMTVSKTTEKVPVTKTGVTTTSPTFPTLPSKRTSSFSPPPTSPSSSTSTTPTTTLTTSVTTTTEPRTPPPPSPSSPPPPPTTTTTTTVETTTTTSPPTTTMEEVTTKWVTSTEDNTTTTAPPTTGSPTTAEQTTTDTSDFASSTTRPESTQEATTAGETTTTTTTSPRILSSTSTSPSTVDEESTTRQRSSTEKHVDTTTIGTSYSTSDAIVSDLTVTSQYESTTNFDNHSSTTPMDGTYENDTSLFPNTSGDNGTTRGNDSTQPDGEVRPVVEKGSETSGMVELIPLIIGVTAGVVVGVVVIGVLTWLWARNQRRKKEKEEEEDQMNIITEYVDTNLNM